jgi:deoxyribodipyrimidine photo-lyase
LKSIHELAIDPRVTVRVEGDPDQDGRAVIYWMQRSQRGVDNPALDTAIVVANQLRRPVAVFFGLIPNYPGANLRHYGFLVEGLQETADRIERRGAAFVFRPYPNHSLLRFCEEVRPCLVIGDENPLREPEAWRRKVAARLSVPFWTVDADVVVPSRLFPKEEYAARTLRPKIEKLVDQFLTPSANPRARYRWEDEQRPPSEAVDARRLLDQLPIDRRVSTVAGSTGGTREGLRRLKRFVREGLLRYGSQRNLPDVDGTSRLSGYLHFGQISPVTVALAVREAEAPDESKAAFLEELIVRRELAINFVARNPDYDSLGGCPAWGRATLEKHASDPRPYIYSEKEFEAGETHDALWSAAQLEMVRTGRMHGYLRMYWAKKILEWSATPEKAFDLAVKLNDRYELDGRDPNGYTGIAWAIGGRHDRPWGPERPIFGLIRYMSASGMARKFDVAAYIRKVNERA